MLHVQEKNYGGNSTSDAIYNAVPFISRYLRYLDPETEVHCNMDMNGVYKGFGITPGPAMRAAGMLLPVISFDAAHMKGLGDRIAIGKTYLAVAPDGDNNIHVLHWPRF